MRKLISKIKKSCTSPIPQPWPLEVEVNRKVEKAMDRRTREIFALADQGLPVVSVSKWLFRIGSLQIWTSSGRWINEESGRRGILRAASVGELIRRESSFATQDVSKANICRGSARADVEHAL